LNVLLESSTFSYLFLLVVLYSHSSQNIPCFIITSWEFLLSKNALAWTQHFVSWIISSVFWENFSGDCYVKLQGKLGHIDIPIAFLDSFINCMDDYFINFPLWASWMFDQSSDIGSEACVELNFIHSLSFP
jgi:hypothetical protein